MAEATVASVRADAIFMGNLFESEQ